MTQRDLISQPITLQHAYRLLMAVTLTHLFLNDVTRTSGHADDIVTRSGIDYSEDDHSHYDLEDKLLSGEVRYYSLVSFTVLLSDKFLKVCSIKPIIHIVFLMQKHGR